MTRSGSFDFLLVIGSILVALIIGELGLQIFHRIHKGEWLWENTAFRIGYTQPVDDRRQYNLRPRYEDPKIGLSIDSEGFRRTVPNTANEKQIIVCLGDSVPFGAGVRDEETYSSYLAATLESYDVGVGVLNAGVASYNLRQSFDRLRKDVFVHHPPEHIHLITVDAANDISLFTYYGPAWTPELTWAEVRWSETWERRSLKKLAVIHYLLRMLDVSRVIQPNSSSHKEVGTSYEHKRREMFEHIRKVLKLELASLEELSIPVILMPINPFYYQLAGQEKNDSLRNWKEWKRFVDDWDQLIREYNDMLLAVSKEAPDVYFFDMRPVMDSRDRQALYADFMHYTPEGNRLVANTLLEFLTKHGLIAAEHDNIKMRTRSIPGPHPPRRTTYAESLPEIRSYL